MKKKDGKRVENAVVTTSVLPSLLKYIDYEFKGLRNKLGAKIEAEFIELLKLLLFCHRHNKNDDYLQNPIVPFSVIRDPMYMHSRAAENTFFSHSTYAFLFLWF